MKIFHQFWGNPPPILGKSVTDFGEIRHRFCGNPSPILGKSVTVFGKLRFWKNRFRVCEKQAPSVGKKPSLCLGKTSRKTGSVWGEIGSGQSSSLTVLNAKHVWVWMFDVLGLML